MKHKGIVICLFFLMMCSHSACQSSNDHFGQENRVLPAISESSTNEIKEHNSVVSSSEKPQTIVTTIQDDTLSETADSKSEKQISSLIDTEPENTIADDSESIATSDCIVTEECVPVTTMQIVTVAEEDIIATEYVADTISQTMMAEDKTEVIITETTETESRIHENGDVLLPEV